MELHEEERRKVEGGREREGGRRVVNNASLKKKIAVDELRMKSYLIYYRKVCTCYYT